MPSPLPLIIGIIFSPVILCLVLVTGSADGASEHNNHMIEVVFFDEPISESVPAEFRTFIENYQNAFDKIDEEISAHSDVEGTFDEAMLKVILYVAYLEQPGVLHFKIKKMLKNRLNTAFFMSNYYFYLLYIVVFSWNL